MFLKQGAWNQIQQWNGIVSVAGFCVTSFLCSKRLHVGALTKNQRMCDLFHITFSLCPSWLCAPLKQDQANQWSNQKFGSEMIPVNPHTVSAVCANASSRFETGITYLACIHVQYKGSRCSIRLMFLGFCLFQDLITWLQSYADNNLCHTEADLSVAPRVTGNKDEFQRNTFWSLKPL